MLRRTDCDTMVGTFEAEAAGLREAGYQAVKMKVGLGPRDDLKLVAAARRGLGDRVDLMVDANHCYTVSDALYVGKGLEELDVRWFEEPVAPEDLAGYRELRQKLTVPIAGGECEFTRWGWRELLAGRCVDIAQPEVCALGGISEYLKVLALAHTHFIPVNNHVWGSAISVATNIHLLTAMPPLPGGLHPWEPMLEYDTTPNRFRDELGIGLEPIEAEMQTSGGTIGILERPGIGVEPDQKALDRYRVC
jgi:D-galactarolactone cycloisomerase